MGLWLAVLSVGLGGCDLVTDLQPDDARPGVADSLQIGLLESGRVVTRLSGDGALQVQTVAPMQAKAATKASTILEEARHACTISLYRPDGPRGPGYYYRSARLAYPDSVVQAADGETVHLTARLSGPVVPHPSKTSSLLRYRLPAVEGAERRVRTFFRASPKQLKASGFERVDSLKRHDSGRSENTGIAKGDCWRERTCIRAEDGSLQNCTEWEYSPCTGGGGGGSVSFGGGMGELPSGGDQTIYGTRTIDPGGIDGGFGDSGPDPEINPCESADPPKWCEIGCKLSASELMPDKSWLALGSADADSVKKFVDLVTEFGGQFGIDNKTEAKHFLAQVSHESASRLLTTEDAVNLSRQKARNHPDVKSDEPKRDGDKVYNLDRIMNSEKMKASIKYAEIVGNGGFSTRDGWRYRGRGAIQLTGKNNYDAFNTFYQSFAQKQGWSHPNLVKNPGHVASNVRIATIAALHFWKNNVDGEIDGDVTVEEVTQLINGGDNGLADRETEFDAITENVDCSN